MYSGDIREDEEEEDGDDDEIEEKLPQNPKVIVPDPVGNEFLTKLSALKLDCIQLHQTLETALETSGICRRYKIGATSSSRSYRKILTEVQPSKPLHSIPAIIVRKNPIRKLPSPRKAATKPRKVKVQSINFVEKQRQELKKYFQKRKELNEKPHLIPLRPKVIKAGFPRKNGTKKSNKNHRKRKVIWLPRKTIPEPFMFTLREETQPTKAHYSLNFLQKLLDEKEEQEAKEQDRKNRQFRARPLPETTYVSDSPFYVGKIKRDKTKFIREPLVPKQLDRFSSTRSHSEPAISPRKHSIPFKAHPIPPSTYLRPSSQDEELRAQAKSQRNIELLLQSREPFGMRDHALRSHVQFRIRHFPTCYSTKPTFQPKITKSVPDFRHLQREFENHLHNARKSRPSTVVEPFHFHDSQLSKHICDNMKSYQRLLKLKKAASSVASSRASTNHTSATFNV